MPMSCSRRATRGSLTVFTLALAVGPAACGDSGEAAEAPPTSAGSSSSSPAEPPSSPSVGPEVKVIEVHIADRQVHTAAERVEVASGETVRLVVTSDVDDELHVHGSDQSAALVAGEPTTLEFTVGEPGLFEVETHDNGLLLFQLLVR